jgi:alanyl-tRNA synthetase
VIFRIFRQSSIAAGIRRIEAFTGEIAERYIDESMEMVRQIAGNFEKQKDLVKAVRGMVEQNSKLSKQVERFQKNMLSIVAKNLENKMERLGDTAFAIAQIDVEEPGQLRDLSFQIRSRYPNLCLVLGAEIGGKAHLAVMLSDRLVETYDLNAAQIIRDISRDIQGGGGGQPFFATAGGKNPDGIQKALDHARQIITDALPNA